MVSEKDKEKVWNRLSESDDEYKARKIMEAFAPLRKLLGQRQHVEVFPVNK